MRFVGTSELGRWRGVARASRPFIGALVLALVAACGSATISQNTASVAVAVTPSTTTAQVGGVPVSFAATIANAANQGFQWQVDGIPGGNATVGTISASGVYLSPPTLPSSTTVTITAVSVADATKSGTASVSLVVDPAGVAVAVSPATVSVPAGSGHHVFVATVSGATNPAVTWRVNGTAGGDATVGTITAGGVYTAPATPPAQPTVTVTAVSVEDPAKLGSAAVTITKAGTSPPTISGSPPTTVVAGHAYAFAPKASSPQGAALTFSIVNKPAWASFSTATGQLSGTPSTTNIGTYANISISVSDGAASASLAPFTITVGSGTTGSVTVSWTPPTTRTDGSTLTNLAGYRIYYGTSSGNYTDMISVTNPGLTTYVVANLMGGATYYFVATAVDANGLESPYTNVGSKTLP
jgi:hypothetical protein